MPTTERNRPCRTLTFTKRHFRRINEFANRSGLTFSRIVGEMIEFSLARGYIPGSISVSDLREEARAAIHERGE